MDIKSYIESGIIENYALGTLPEEESSILHCVMSHNAAVKSAVVAAQETINELSTSYSMPPPPELKEKIFSQINFEKPAAEKQADALPSLPVEEKRSTDNETDKVRQTNSGLWLAAASILLLATLGYALFQNQEIKKELITAHTQNAAREQKMQALAAQNTLILNSENIPLKGVAKHPGMEANIYWDSSKTVYLSLKNLPKAPEGRQYQLWAIVDGKPVSAGMYKDGAGKVQEMKVIEKAQAFAITLEKTGGSETPTMEEMYVMGEV